MAPCVGLFFAGCHIQPPGGAPITPRPLGCIVDDANAMQEANAELAKLVVYNHEFEINGQNEAVDLENWQQESSFQIQPHRAVSGIRLNPYGQDHIRQIAHVLTDNANPNLKVIVERSQSSKQWRTRHRYPVHFNDELDETRRQVVVASLAALGVPHPEELVVVSPVISTGQDAQEAAAAYQSTMRNSGTFYNSGSGVGGSGVGGFF